jgi:hypothetical protein
MPRAYIIYERRHPHRHGCLPRKHGKPQARPIGRTFRTVSPTVTAKDKVVTMETAVSLLRGRVDAPARCSIRISRSCARICRRSLAISLRIQSSFTVRSDYRGRRRTSGSASRRRTRRIPGSRERDRAAGTTAPHFRLPGCDKLIEATAIKRLISWCTTSCPFCSPRVERTKFDACDCS